METPIAAVLWPEDARRDMGALFRLLAHLESACLDIGADDAASHLADAANALARTASSRRRAA